MKTTVVVLDGMGGGAGAQVVEKIRKTGIDLQIIALGTNSLATQRMMEAGADRGATGENAIRVSVGLGDYVVGPLGMVIPDSLMGEVTTVTAAAVASARGKKFFLPLHQTHFTILGLEARGLGELINELVSALTKEINTKA